MSALSLGTFARNMSTCMLLLSFIISEVFGLFAIILPGYISRVENQRCFSIDEL